MSNKEPDNELIDIQIKDNIKTDRQKPPWLKVRLPTGKPYQQMQELMSKLDLHSVCQ